MEIKPKSNVEEIKHIRRNQQLNINVSLNGTTIRRLTNIRKLRTDTKSEKRKILVKFHFW